MQYRYSKTILELLDEPIAAEHRCGTGVQTNKSTRLPEVSEFPTKRRIKMDCPDTSFTRFSGRTWRLKAAVHQLGMAAIERDFKDFNRIRRQLTEVASSIMGSGWAALVWEPIGKRLLITQIYDHQSNLAQAGVLTQSTMLPPAHAAFCRPGLFYTHGAVSPIAHGAAIFDHWSCRTFSHPKVIFSLSVGGSPLPLRFVLAPVVMVFSKLSPRPNWNVSC